MSNRDRFNPARARKAFACAVSDHASAKAERHAAKRVAKAARREAAARKRYLAELRGAEEAEAWA